MVISEKNIRESFRMVKGDILVLQKQITEVSIQLDRVLELMAQNRVKKAAVKLKKPKKKVTRKKKPKKKAKKKKPKKKARKVKKKAKKKR